MQYYLSRELLPFSRPLSSVKHPLLLIFSFPAILERVFFALQNPHLQCQNTRSPANHRCRRVVSLSPWKEACLRPQSFRTSLQISCWAVEKGNVTGGVAGSPPPFSGTAVWEECLYPLPLHFLLANGNWRKKFFGAGKIHALGNSPFSFFFFFFFKRIITKHMRTRPS